MHKSTHQNAIRTDATHGGRDVRRTAMSGKRKMLRLAWVLALCVSVAGFATLALFSDSTTWIDATGFLHEPLFGLIPISFFFLLVGLALAAIDAVLTLRKHRNERSAAP